MATTENPLTYEEQRQRIIQGNKRRMEELGLTATLAALQTKGTQPTMRKILRDTPNVENICIEIRRSSRAACLPKVDYKEVNELHGNFLTYSIARPQSKGGVDTGLHRPRVVGRSLRRGIATVAKNEAVATSGHCSHPSFVKAMLKSHTSGGFWLGLPSDFCSTYFFKDDLLILEDEDGMEWECVYLHHKHGLSGGWRGFSIDHELDDGDAVVFELVTSSRFKVHITRAGKVGAGHLSVQRNSACKKKSHQYVVKGSGNVRVESDTVNALKWEKESEVRPIGNGKPVIGRGNRGKVNQSCDVSEGLGKEESSEDDSQSEEHVYPPLVLMSDASTRLGKLKLDRRPTSVFSVELSSQRRAETLKTQSKMGKKETFVRQTPRKIKLHVGRKETAACQVEQKRHLPPGTRLKPVGVCSIAKRCAKRKLPAVFSARKNSFFSGPK